MMLTNCRLSAVIVGPGIASGEELLVVFHLSLIISASSTSPGQAMILDIA